MRTLTAVAVAVLVASASLAHAQLVPVPNLTGTWTGKLACKGISLSPGLFGEFNFVDPAADLVLTQSGSDLAARVTATDPDYPFPLLVDPMCGPVVVNPAKPTHVRAGLSALMFGSPGTAFAVDFSTVKVFAANKKGITGKLTGSGVLIGSGIGGGISGTCKWTFARTSDLPPASPPESCEVM